MPREDAAIMDDARSFLDELFGAGVPIHNLLRTGTFPDGWVDRYLAFVDRVSAQYGDDLPLPREVMAVIYNASVYCTKRYSEWQRFTGGANEVTEALVNKVRWAGDALVSRRFFSREEPTA